MELPGNLLAEKNQLSGTTCKRPGNQARTLLAHKGERQVGGRKIDEEGEEWRRRDEEGRVGGRRRIGKEGTRRERER